MFSRRGWQGGPRQNPHCDSLGSYLSWTPVLRAPAKAFILAWSQVGPCVCVTLRQDLPSLLQLSTKPLDES